MTLSRLAPAGFLLLAACASPEEIARVSDPAAGFETVSARTDAALAVTPVRIADAAAVAEAEAQVRALVAGKTIDADTAVRVALLNDRSLQAAYAAVGMSAADLWQAMLPLNPKVELGLFGLGADGLGLLRAVEAAVVGNIVSLATRDQRVAIADAGFRRTQLEAVEATLRVAAETRRAWIEAVAAFEQAALIRRAQGTAQASSELAARLGETGFLDRAAQAREHVLYAELTAQRAQARLAAQLAKERLTRRLGLWGADLDYFVPDALPSLPKRPEERPSIEAEALRARVDLAIARLDLDAAALRLGLTGATRMVSDLELAAGLELERENEDGDIATEVTPQLEVEFEIPVFDSGDARMRKAELAHLSAAHLLAAKAVAIRSEARAAVAAHAGTWRIARHWRDEVLPLRRVIEDEALLNYNGMIESPFDLLAAVRGRLNAALAEAAARRDFFLAEAALAAAIHGGGGDASVAVADLPAEAEAPGH